VARCLVDLDQWVSLFIGGDVTPRCGVVDVDVGMSVGLSLLVLLHLRAVVLDVVER
jgi:hypothetical protein